MFHLQEIIKFIWCLDINERLTISWNLKGDGVGILCHFIVQPSNSVHFSSYIKNIIIACLFKNLLPVAATVYQVVATGGKKSCKPVNKTAKHICLNKLAWEDVCFSFSCQVPQFWAYSDQAPSLCIFLLLHWTPISMTLSYCPDL